ncbi:MAG: VanW family protein [Firmicutes bacterium]|nr:VanW family protein [Bacillota bacterium]
MKKTKILLIILLLAVSLGLVLIFVNSPQDRIYTHIYIHGVPVGGLTTEEADAVLMEHFQPGLENKTIQYSVGKKIIAEFAFADFGARLNFSEPIQLAMAYSTAGNLQSRLMRMFGRAYEINASARLEIIPQRMESIFSGISRQISKPVQNAGFALENGNIVVIPEQVGYGMDTQAIALATDKVLRSLESGVVEIILQTIQPNYTMADFDFEVSVIGSFQTEYAGTDTDPRIHNVRLAAEKIHNRVLYPGEVFSTGAIVGAHRPNSGYKPAIVLVRGEPVEDIGGGVCQVVSTLYNAVLMAELPVVQRHNHSVPVSYVDSGFDATVAGDYYDLKFKNNTLHPILITSQMTDGNLQIFIHGHENRPANRSIRFQAKRVETIAPGPYREVIDNTIPQGERYITLQSQEGYHIKLYKHIYVDGSEVEVVQINTSIYKPLQGVIAIGTG